MWDGNLARKYADWRDPNFYERMARYVMTSSEYREKESKYAASEISIILLKEKIEKLELALCMLGVKV